MNFLTRILILSRLVIKRLSRMGSWRSRKTIILSSFSIRAKMCNPLLISIIFYAQGHYEKIMDLEKALAYCKKDNEYITWGKLPDKDLIQIKIPKILEWINDKDFKITSLLDHGEKEKLILYHCGPKLNKFAKNVKQHKYVHFNQWEAIYCMFWYQ